MAGPLQFVFIWCRQCISVELACLGDRVRYSIKNPSRVGHTGAVILQWMTLVHIVHIRTLAWHDPLLCQGFNLYATQSRNSFFLSLFIVTFSITSRRGYSDLPNQELTSSLIKTALDIVTNDGMAYLLSSLKSDLRKEGLVSGKLTNRRLLLMHCSCQLRGFPATVNRINGAPLLIVCH